MLAALRRTDTATLVQNLVLVVLGGIGAAAGFAHTHDWAMANGQTGWLAWAVAVVIEGMAIVAGFEVRRDHAQGRSARFPMTVLVLAFGIQMTAQVAEAKPTPAGWLLAAMPALGFLTVVKLVMRRTPAAPAPAASADPTHPLPAPAATSTPAAPAGSPSTVRLPADLHARVTELAHTAHTQGRPVTVEEIRTAVALPAHLLTALAAELNTSVNGHPA